MSSGFLCRDGSTSKLLILSAGALLAIIELNDDPLGRADDTGAVVFGFKLLLFTLLIGPSTGLFLLFYD